MRRLALTLLALTACSLAQINAPTPTAPSDGEGIDLAGYHVQQTIEAGYRFVSTTGNPDVYNTFINQHEGPRLFDQTLSMRAPNNTGVLFDDLYLSSFGWGGDPENAARLRVSKGLWYDFSFSFRRDQNFFDYDLLANPLNPPTSNPNIPVIFSPHGMALRRRMYDTSLTLFPQAKFSVRLGYSRNRAEGPSFSSVHEGTDALLLQAWNVTSDDFFIGFDFKPLARTTISYDQAVQTDKNDTNFGLEPFTVFPVAPGVSADFGLPINVPASQPCRPFILGTGFANSVCSGYFAYLRTQRVRTTIPTEQVSFQSNYFKRLNLIGRASYSSGDMSTPFLEFFNGLITRTNQRQFEITGPASGHRLNVAADLAATLKLTEHWNVSDNFRYDNFHIPAIFNSLETDWVGVPVPSSLLSPLTSTPTVTPGFVPDFLGQKSFYNTTQLEYSPSKRFGTHFGYRFRHRRVFKSEPELTIDPESGLPEFEGDLLEVNEHTGLGGVWFRPIDSLRISFDAEFTRADDFITRVSPTQVQNYRVRGTYKPVKWANLAANLNFWKASNDEGDTQALQRYNNAGLVVSLFPNDRFGLDLSYDYTDALQNAFICFNGTFLPVGALANACPTFDATNNNNPNWIYSRYNANTNYLNANFLFKPVKKLTIGIGYGFTHNDGFTTVLNPLQPFGPLQFSYHQPFASLKYELVKGFSLNGYWNYDQYTEDSFVGPTAPRLFHDNRTMLTARYSF